VFVGWFGFFAGLLPPTNVKFLLAFLLRAFSDTALFSYLYFISRFVSPRPASISRWTHQTPSLPHGLFSLEVHFPPCLFQRLLLGYKLFSARVRELQRFSMLVPLFPLPVFFTPDLFTWFFVSTFCYAPPRHHVSIDHRAKARFDGSVLFSLVGTSAFNIGIQ